MPKLSKIAVLSLVLVLALVGAGPTDDRGFDPTEKLRFVGELDGGLVVLGVDEACCSSGRYSTDWSLYWLPKDPPTATAVASSGESIIGRIQHATVSGDVVELGESEDFRWRMRYDKKTHTFTEIATPVTSAAPADEGAGDDVGCMARALARTEKSAAAGKIEEAYYGAIEARSETCADFSPRNALPAPGGSLIQLHEALLAGAHKAALKAHKAKKGREAALLACRFLALPGIGDPGEEARTTESSTPTLEAPRRLTAKPAPDAKITPYVLSAGPKTIERLNDLGFFLERAGFARDAWNYLESLTHLAPERLVLRLNAADAAWATGEPTHARRHYAAYEKLFASQKKGGKIPAYVKERLAPSAPPPPSAAACPTLDLPTAPGDATLPPRQREAIKAFLAKGGSPDAVVGFDSQGDSQALATHVVLDLETVKFLYESSARARLDHVAPYVVDPDDPLFALIDRHMPFNRYEVMERSVPHRCKWLRGYMKRGYTLNRVAVSAAFTCTAPACAGEMGCKAIVTSILAGLDAGARAEVLGRGADSLVRKAVENGKADLLEALIAVKADLDSPDVDGVTPLALAETKNPHLAEILRKAGAKRGEPQLHPALPAGTLPPFPPRKP